MVDLGAAPGGWTSLALARGARVIAVDRGAMSPELVGHPRLEILREDAFAFVPDLQPTFLFCDVIAEPSRTFALLERALTWPALKGAVVTLKLKRPLDTQVLAMARALSKRAPRHFGRTKNLVANKCEVTAMFAVRNAASPGAP